MGFMGSCPIAGVIWQHLHYIVGLQRLGHEVYYIEDSARIPYNAETFDTNNDYTYATKLLARLADEFDFTNRWAFCARYIPELPAVGLTLKKIRQLYKSADAILNVCGTQEFPKINWTQSFFTISRSRNSRACLRRIWRSRRVGFRPLRAC